MARQVHIKVTVNGIKDQADVMFVTQAGADTLQGNFVGPPLPTNLLASWLNTMNRVTTNSAFNARA